MFCSPRLSTYDTGKIIYTNILLGNICWLVLNIIREFNDHSKSGLGFWSMKHRFILDIN
jgi:hypothetical protein